MFTTMCALLAAGFESNVSSDNWTAFRAQMRERLRQQQGPAVDAVRQFYRQHELRDPGATLSRYLWFGLVSGPAPAFQPILRRDELPPEVIALFGFSELLSSYYQEQKIGDLWRQVQPIYNREIQRLQEPLTQIGVEGADIERADAGFFPRALDLRLHNHRRNDGGFEGDA